MRMLNPVAAHEVYVAQGTYKRFVSGAITPYVEGWTLHAHRDGGYLARIDQDARQTEGWSRLAEVRMDSTGQVERVLLRMVHEGQKADFKQMRVDYVFDNDVVLVTRRVDGADADHAEIALPADTYVRLIEFNLFWGGALRRAQSDTVSEMPVFVLFYKPALAPGQVVTGALPAIKSATQATVNLGNREVVVTRYQTGGERVIDVDTNGIAVQVHHGRMAQQDLISDYAYR